MKKSITIKSILIESYLIIVIMSAFTTIITIIDFNILVPNLWYRIIIVLLILISSFLIALLKTAKKKVVIKINENSEMNIFYGDIFKQTSIIVIPFNSHFDTLVDDEVVSSKSLQGQFITNIFVDNLDNLDIQIEKSLKDYKYIIDKERISGKKNIYPIGTIVKVKKDESIYYLLALTNFDRNNKAICTLTDYKKAIDELYSYIETYSQGKQVNMPLIAGGGLSRFKRSKQTLLNYMVMQARINDYSFIGGINIILSKEIRKEINLNLIKFFEKI